MIFNQKFESRAEINDLLGGDIVKGIVPTEKSDAILLFTNENEIYTDYFYPRGTYDYCMYTGIGRYGNQDSLDNNMYNLNIAVMTHKKNGKPLLLFEKRKAKYYFIGEYELTGTHQNLQPDHNNAMRRVFVFHLKRVRSEFSS
ncbi:MAG: hypothetical protein RR413_04500 [Christensenellaceae bacterium]